MLDFKAVKDVMLGFYIGVDYIEETFTELFRHRFYRYPYSVFYRLRMRAVTINI